MLRICGVQGTGNLFADLISVVQGVQSKATLFENLLMYTFEVVRRNLNATSYTLLFYSMIKTMTVSLVWMNYLPLFKT